MRAAVVLAALALLGVGPTEILRFDSASGPVERYELQLTPRPGLPPWSLVFDAAPGGAQEVEVPCVQGATFRARGLAGGRAPGPWGLESEPLSGCWNPDADGDACYTLHDFGAFRAVYGVCWR